MPPKKNRMASLLQMSFTKRQMSVLRLHLEGWIITQVQPPREQGAHPSSRLPPKRWWALSPYSLGALKVRLWREDIGYLMSKGVFQRVGDTLVPHPDVNVGEVLKAAASNDAKGKTFDFVFVANAMRFPEKTGSRWVYMPAGAIGMLPVYPYECYALVDHTPETISKMKKTSIKGVPSYD